MNDNHLKLGELLSELEHQLYRANLPPSFRPSNLPGANPNLSPLSLTQRQMKQLEQRIVNTRLNIMRAAKDEMSKKFDKLPSWVQDEINALEKALKDGEK